MTNTTRNYSKENGSIDISSAVEAAETLRRAEMQRKVGNFARVSHSAIARILARFTPSGREFWRHNV